MSTDTSDTQVLAGVTYSLVLPVFNESETLPALYDRLSDLLARLDAPSEVIFVDDGSSDHSAEIILDLRERDPRLKLVRLARNFGHQIAITAGMDVAQGDAVIIMDADLQDPPEVVLALIEAWRAGHEVVYAVREERHGETWFKRKSAELFYRLLDACSDVRIPLDTGDFRLVDRKAIETFKGLRERNRFVRGLFSWIGFRQKGVHYVRAGRFAGETKYTMKKMLRLATDALIGFSKLPLRLPFYAAGAMGMVGLLVAIAGVLDLVSAMIAVLVVFLSFCTALQCTLLGVLGLYLGQVYDEAKARPLYTVLSTHGVPLSARVVAYTVDAA